MSVPRKAIDTDMGEVILLNKGDRVVRAKSIEKASEIQEWKITHFYKGNIGEIRKQLEALSVYEKAFLFAIVTYIGYQDCCIKYDNGRCMGFDDLVSLNNMGRTKTQQTIKSLINKDIVYKGHNSKGIQYFVNPWLFCKGNSINKVLQTMFRNYKIKVCNEVKWGDSD